MNTNYLNKLATHPLQTTYWGGFRKEWGNEVHYTKHGLITAHYIPFTKYKIGMLIKGQEPTKEMLRFLKDFAKENDLIFIKMEPNIIKSKVKGQRSKLQLKNQNFLDEMKRASCVPGKTLFTPTTFWIDLTKTEDELMEGFHSKTRYNIRYAIKKGVEVVEDNSEEAFEKYLELMRETVERQGFYAHTENYHRLMWKHLHKNPSQPPHGKGRSSLPLSKGELEGVGKPIARLLTAKHKGEIITAWIVFVWKDFLYYPYGAASMKKKNLQANNLMMWEAIRYGKKMGLKTFDLWGREPDKGFTKFKEGFSPEIIEFLGTWDLPISPLYYPFRAADYFRWKYLRLKASLRTTKPKF